jgi:CheY-like chemotaxis protein
MIQNKPVVLLVEDDQVSAIILQEWLLSQGWHVEHVVSGTEAIRRFTELHPELVLADVLLPGLDGVGLCTQIRLQAFGDRAQIGLMSSLPSVQTAAQGAGADFFVSKPIRFEELGASLRKLRESKAAPESQSLPMLEPTRVPTAPVLGQIEKAWKEDGELKPGSLAELLYSLFESRFTGVLEAWSQTTAPVRTKIFFDRGLPVSARANDTRTGFARILEQRSLLGHEVLAEAIEESRRSRLFLGEVLLKSRLLDYKSLERTLREQILARLLTLETLQDGYYTLQAADQLGLAGFEVHPAAVEWRLGTRRSLSAALELFLHPSHFPTGFWELLDPAGEYRHLVMLLKAGITVETWLGIHPDACSLLALLFAWQLVALRPEPPGDYLDPSPRQDEQRRLEAWEQDLAQRLQIAQDATHYTVLGVLPQTDTEDIQIAGLSLLAGLQEDTLPVGLSQEGRARATRLTECIREACRILGDPIRRAIYDARLADRSELTLTLMEQEDNPVLQADRAHEHFRKNEFVTAAALLAMAAAGSEDPELLSMLGWARHRACMEDPTAGEPELRKALELDPDNEFALCYLGQLLSDCGQSGEARRVLKKAIALNHEFQAARDALKRLDAEDR